MGFASFDFVVDPHRNKNKFRLRYTVSSYKSIDGEYVLQVRSKYDKNSGSRKARVGYSWNQTKWPESFKPTFVNKVWPKFPPLLLVKCELDLSCLFMRFEVEFKLDLVKAARFICEGIHTA